MIEHLEIRTYTAELLICTHTLCTSILNRHRCITSRQHASFTYISVWKLIYLTMRQALPDIYDLIFYLKNILCDAKLHDTRVKIYIYTLIWFMMQQNAYRVKL